jgi:hypothetical protein
MKAGQLLAAAFLTAASAARAACTEATEFEPRLCPAHLPAIRVVTIERNALQTGTEPQHDSDCSRFVLTPKLVQRFFRRARRVEDIRGEEAVERGPCQAEGRLRFADGRSARWMIEQVGTGTLWIGSSPPITLHCPNCDFRPFRG